MDNHVKQYFGLTEIEVVTQCPIWHAMVIVIRYVLSPECFFFSVYVLSAEQSI
jgi:hypothetical protein